MHICFLSTYFPQPCGIASYTHYLSEALCASDTAISVTVLAEQGSQNEPHSMFRVCPAFNRDSMYPNQLIEQVKQVSPDILHIQHEYGIFGYDRRFIDLL